MKKTKLTLVPDANNNTASASRNDLIARLESLKERLDSTDLTQKEFEEIKAQVREIQRLL